MDADIENNNSGTAGTISPGPESQTLGNRRNTQIDPQNAPLGSQGMRKNPSMATLKTMNSASYKPPDVIIMEGEKMISLADKHNPIAKREHDLLVSRH